MTLLHAFIQPKGDVPLTMSVTSNKTDATRAWKYKIFLCKIKMKNVH